VGRLSRSPLRGEYPRSAATRGRGVLAIASVALLLSIAGCGSEAGSADPTTTTAASAATTATTTTTTSANALAGFERIEVGLGTETWTVALADTVALRSQGLMGVTDLGDVDGMLFVWEEEISAAFWMKDTLIPLDIAFFDADGALVDTFTMQPCEEDPCPRYPAAGPFQYAIETTVGGFGDVPLTLEVASLSSGQ